MILVRCSQKCALFLWSLSGLISNRLPSGCLADNKKKGALFVSDDSIFQRSYRLEDFFWTGSGDGPLLEDSFTNDTENQSKSLFDHFDLWRTTTVFHTTTVLFATVYPNGNSCPGVDCKPKTSPVWTGSVEFSSPAYPSFFDIKPSPTEKHTHTTTFFGNMTIFSEITKVLTVTERITAQGKDFKVTPVETMYSNPSTTVVPTQNVAGDFYPREGSGEAFPRFDVELNSTASSAEPNIPADQRYWLLTVLKRNNYPQELKIHMIEEKLSVLYRKAFIRQQEKHLGINGNSLTTTRPRRDRRIPEPVRVHIHNITDMVNKDADGIGLLYFVTVAGKPVPALTAANDMKLISMTEVVAELGYPVLTKAEPYLKGAVPIGARIKGRTRDTWLLIGAVIAAVSLLIILAIIFTFGLSRRGDNHSATRSTNNKKDIFEAEEGSNNLAFQDDSDRKAKTSSPKSREGSSKFDNSRMTEGLASTTVTFADQRRGSSSSSSCSGSSEASLVRLRHQQKKKEQRREALDEKPRPRPRTRIRRIENVDETLEDVKTSRVTSSGTISRDRESCGGITTEGIDDAEFTPRITRTPTSYLSMPSVKAFPRGARIPEPLSRVLEPISIRYLDGDADNIPRSTHCGRAPEEEYEIDFSNESQPRFEREKKMTRHSSLEGDPGVIGPVVWKRQYFKTDNQEKDGLDIAEADGNINVGKMRKRFNDLLDDAFSMFGSRNESPEEKDKCGDDSVVVRYGDSRIHSAIIRPAESFYRFSFNGRPKTTDSRRPFTAVNVGPRGAWDSPSCSTPSKVAAEASPTVDKGSVLVDSNLSPSDPAIPLIKAIKDELQKFDQASTRHSDKT